MASTWRDASHVSLFLLILILAALQAAFAQPVGSGLAETEFSLTHGVGFPEAAPSPTGVYPISLQARRINQQANNQRAGHEIRALDKPDTHQTLSKGGKAIIGVSIGVAALIRELSCP